MTARNNSQLPLIPSPLMDPPLDLLLLAPDLRRDYPGHRYFYYVVFSLQNERELDKTLRSEKLGMYHSFEIMDINYTDFA